MTVQRAFKLKFNVDPPTNKSILKWHRNFIERECICDHGWAAGTHHCSCQVGHAGYAAVSLVRARLLHLCLPSNKRDAHWLCVCDTTWNCMSLCNCSHQFCKNIPVSFDLITTWNQGVFLCSPCTLHHITGLKKTVMKNCICMLLILASHSECWQNCKHWDS